MNNQINNLIPKILKFELSYIKMFIYTVYSLRNDDASKYTLSANVYNSHYLRGDNA